LDEAHKKRVSEIRQRNKEKKQLRESTPLSSHMQETDMKVEAENTEDYFTEKSSSDNLPPSMNNENGRVSQQKSEQGLIREMISSKEEDEKHATEISASNDPLKGYY